MYRGFELTLNEVDLLSSDGKYSKLLSERRDEIINRFNEVLLSNGKIDADKIIAEWFPSGQYHVFISHSHKDLKLAEQLANWLYDKFNINSFLDSHVWGYANNLLKELNEKYARNGDETYAYEPAISNAAHVYLMLSTALSEAIDKSECLFFINTENTIESMQIEGSEAQSRTASPWIMHELKTSAMIRKHFSSDRQKYITEGVGLEALAKSANFSFSVSTEHLSKIDENSLITWKDDCAVECDFISIRQYMDCIKHKKTEYDALDIFYALFPMNEGS